MIRRSRSERRRPDEVFSQDFRASEMGSVHRIGNGRSRCGAGGRAVLGIDRMSA